MFAFLKSALGGPGFELPRRSPALKCPEQEEDTTVGSDFPGMPAHRQRSKPRLPGSARRILVGMNIAGPSGTNKQLPTTPPPQPLLSSARLQKSEEGKRKNIKNVLFPELFTSVCFCSLLGYLL